ncbi:hypothetical protein BC829DRAFT_448341 [Chytridium lagenaria]|nr:hypothetical protein BC829DRAFT_448341 [Chytridium lagenaria]
MDSQQLPDEELPGVNKEPVQDLGAHQTEQSPSIQEVYLLRMERTTLVAEMDDAGETENDKPDSAGDDSDDASEDYNPSTDMDVEPNNREFEASLRHHSSAFEEDVKPAVKSETPGPPPQNSTSELGQGFAIQNSDIIVPSYAAWFSLSAIHDTEKKALPEFFNGRNKSKTPQVYKDYRDFIINTYRLNPTEYLTITACRRNLAGDVCSIIRVHNFLEQWGLINYQVDPDSKPVVVGPAYTGHFRVTADTPRGFQPLGPNVSFTAREASSQNKGPVIPTPLPTLPPTVLPSQAASLKRGPDETDDDAMDESGPSSSRRPNRLAGRYPSSANAGDFARRDERDQAVLHGDKASWNDQETLLLLEGLEMFPESWDRIADHVGTRTKDQCILKFLDLPIEDPFLEESGANLGPLHFSMFPFSVSDNPILSVVAMLASVVKPEVAKASAKAATDMLQNGSAELTEKKAVADAVSAKEVTKEEGGDKEKANVVMEVDAAKETVESKTDELNPSEVKDNIPVAEGTPAPTSATSAAPPTDVMQVDDKATEKPAEEQPSIPVPEADGPVKTETQEEVDAEQAKVAIETALSAHDGSRTSSLLEKSAATALGAAAARAFTIAHTQEEECRRLVERVIELQLQKMALKMQCFGDIEKVVLAEREDLGRQKKMLAVERAAFRKEKAAFYAARASSAAVGGDHATVAMATGGGAASGIDIVRVQKVEVTAEDKEQMGSNFIMSIG